MKINQNSTMRISESTVTPEKEMQSVQERSPASSTENAANVGQQQMTTEAKSISNLTAGLLQRSLANALPSKSELLTNVAVELRPKVPEMLAKSENDPDRFISTVREQVESPTFLKSFADKSTGIEQAGTTTWAVLGAMNGQDIEAIAFLVLMQAAKSANEDLKDIMNGVKEINKSKQQMRELMFKASQDSAHKLKDDDD